MRIFRVLLALLAVAVIATHPLFAQQPPAFGTPEIDPSMGLGSLALLGGTVLVIRGRAKH